MEQHHDPELGNLLRQWRVPPHSAELEQRVLGTKLPWLGFLLTGSIRVPVPVALGLAIVMTFGAWRAAHTETIAPCISASKPPASVACPASTRC